MREKSSGSFNEKATEIADNKNKLSLGFNHDGVPDTVSKPYENVLTMDDVMKYGLIKEVASRIIDMVCVRPLTLEDYIGFMNPQSDISVIKQVEDKYSINVKVSKKVRLEIAKAAFESGLGLRNVVNRLRALVDTNIFSQWDDLQRTGGIIL